MKTEQIPGAITDVEKELNWTESDQEALENQIINNMLVGSLAHEKVKKEGLGHQYRSKEKGLKACESFLRQASKSLDGTIQTDLKVRIELLITDVIAEAAGAQDRYNEND